jgi:hypothetical protein
MSKDDGLVAFLEGWQRSLARLQRAYPARWQVPGLSDEEVRDALVLHLLEAVRSDQNWDRGQALPILRRQLAVLRRSFRLGAVPMDLSAAPLAHCEPDHEQRCLELEANVRLLEAAESAKVGLSQPQRRWFSAFKFAAQCGQFFAASDEPNLSAASRALGKHRSSAQRAYSELQTHFRRERRRLGD